MNLSYFATFVQVAKLKSFSRAAEVLRLTQPAVSFQIHALEKAYQEVFFDRSGQSIELTDAGKIFLSYAEEILKLNDKLMDSLSELRDLVRGSIEIGASNIPGEFILPKLMGEFKHQYPDVSLKLSIYDTAEVISKLLTHEINLGFCGAAAKKVPLIYEEFAVDELVIACSAGSHLANKKELSLKDILNNPIVLREEGSGTRKVFLQELERKGRSLEDLNIVLELGSTQAVLSAVSSGIGITPVSYFAVIDHVEAGTIKAFRVKDMNLKRPLYIAYNEKAPFSKAQAAFLEFVRERKEALMNMIPA